MLHVRLSKCTCLLITFQRHWNQTRGPALHSELSILSILSETMPRIQGRRLQPNHMQPESLASWLHGARLFPLLILPARFHPRLPTALAALPATVFERVSGTLVDRGEPSSHPRVLGAAGLAAADADWLGPLPAHRGTPS